MNRTAEEKAAREITELIDGWESHEPQMADIIERVGGQTKCDRCDNPVVLPNELCDDCQGESQ